LRVVPGSGDRERRHDPQILEVSQGFDRDVTALRGVHAPGEHETWCPGDGTRRTRREGRSTNALPRDDTGSDGRAPREERVANRAAHEDVVSEPNPLPGAGPQRPTLDGLPDEATGTRRPFTRPVRE